METNTAPGGVQPAGDSTALVAELGRWLGRERSLSLVSVQCYSKQSKAFLTWIGGAGAVSGLDAGKVTAFMVDWTAGRNTWTAKAMVTSLRAFLRFAHATGRTAVPLAGAVPSVASWRRSPLPRGLKAAGNDPPPARRGPGTGEGPRGHPVLSPPARPGPRGGEAGRRDHGHRQGQPDRAAPAAGPGGGGPGRLAEGRPAVLRAAVGVRDDPAAPPAHDAGAGPGHHGQGLRAGRPGADGSSPPAALPGHRAAAGRGPAPRGRARA